MPPPTRRAADRLLPRSVWAAWLGSRGVIVVVLLFLAVTTHRAPVDLVRNWDVLHFLSISEQGYGAAPQDVAFFPGLPMLLRVFAALGISPEWGGVLVSAVSSILASAALVRLGGPWAAIGWLFAPVAVFTFVPYTESLFCALAFWAWVMARRDDWAWAGVLAAAACTVRVSGLFLWGALGLLLLTTVPWRRWGQRIGWLLLPPLVLFGYGWFLYTLTGSWTAWYSAQEAGWQRTLTWPWESIGNTLEMIASGYVDANGWGVAVRGEVVAFAVGLVTVGWCIGRRLWAEASWVLVQLLAFSMSFWLMSVNRAVLLWFPTWLMLASFVELRPRTRSGRLLQWVCLGAIAVGCLVLLVWWAQQFFQGLWSS